MTEFLEACYRAIKAQAESIPETLRTVKKGIVEGFRGHDVILTGCGDSYAVAWYGVWALRRVGARAIAVSATEVKRLHLDGDSVVVGITASGRSLATIAALKGARERGARTVVLTDNEEGTAARDADEVWVTHAGVDSYNISPSSPTTTAMAYLLGLSALTVDHDTPEKHDCERLEHACKSIVDWAEYAGERLSEFIDVERTLYLVSDGPNHVAAQLGQMKFNEYSLLRNMVALREEFCHHWNLNLWEGDQVILITDSPSTERDEEYLRVVTDRLGMSAYHLHTEEGLGLRSDLGQAIANTIALQMAAYYSVLQHDPEKSGWRQPNADAFKIY